MKVEQLAKEKCQYPTQDEEGNVCGCGEKQMMSVSLPMLKTLESGAVEASEGESIVVPFCNKHCFIVMGGDFGMMFEKEQMHLHGPFGAVELIKTVVNSMLLSGEIKESLQAQEKVDKQLEDKK